MRCVKQGHLCMDTCSSRASMFFSSAHPELYLIPVLVARAIEILFFFFLNFDIHILHSWKYFYIFSMYTSKQETNFPNGKQSHFPCLELHSLWLEVSFDTKDSKFSLPFPSC